MVYFKIYISLFLSIFCWISFVNSGTIDPTTPDNVYIEYGKKFYCIAKLCGKYQDGTPFCGSSVIIDKHHILTAAHVVKNYNNCFVILDDKKFQLSSISIHEDFETGGFGTGDIALGYCQDNFGLDGYPPIYQDNDEIGKICAISGYGLTGNFIDGAKISDNKKRAGSNKIDYIYKDLLICSPSKKQDAGYTDLEFLIGSGDSGGGLFIDGKLAGINSCVTAIRRSPASKYGEESGHTRVSKFIKWINEHKKKVD